MSEKLPASSEALDLQPQPARDLVLLLSQKLVAQSAAIEAIVLYLYMYQSGLAPQGRPGPNQRII